ncbi:hypothetical protein [Streptomyces sp. NPDC005780]|uniref:hypothetical protein n=1 Tax=Streptomyces sp. NPDC005780 TaxID=3364730 RepID=UPI0036A02917
MTPTATFVGACCSLLRAGHKRPAGMSRSVDLSGLVDAEGGRVDRAVITDAGLCRQERGGVFARTRACLDSCPHCGTLVPRRFQLHPHVPPYPPRPALRPGRTPW